MTQMRAVKGTYYKAILLLLVFSMNTVVSFACSFSSDFHALHHHKQDESNEHAHSGHHHQLPEAEHQAAHAGSGHEPHDHSAPVPATDDCCSNFVIAIEKMDKSISKTIDAPAPGFVTGYFISFISSVFPTPVLEEFSPQVRWRPPLTIPDLRIVIQSFQI